MRTRRAVIDTNIFLSAHTTKNEGSPNVEMTRRWYNKEFLLLYTLGILSKYEEKLVEKGVASEQVRDFLRLVVFWGEFISVKYVHRRYYPRDPDDVEFLLAALEGKATHLITYDKHLHEIAYRYKENYLTCEPIKFLEELRKEK